MLKTNTMGLLTIDEAAEYLELSIRSIRRLVDEGKVAVFRIGPGRRLLRFSPEDLEAYLEGCRTFGSIDRPLPASLRRRRSRGA